MNTIKIIFSKIPNVFPNITFTDELNVQHYPIYAVLEPKEILETERQFSTVDAPFIYKFHKIQSLFYETFELKMTVNRSVNTGLIPLAENITVFDNDGYELQVREIQSYTVDDVSGTEFKTINLVFTVSQNFAEAVINYLTADTLLSEYSVTALNRFYVTLDPRRANFSLAGTRSFASGYNFSTDNKTLLLQVDFYPSGSNTAGITLTQNCTTIDDVVSHINDQLSASFGNYLLAYKSGTQIAFTIVSAKISAVQLLSGTFLSVWQISAGTYTVNSILDGNFEDIGNEYTFYTKLNFVATNESNIEQVEIDNLNVPVFSLSKAFVELDFILDDYTKLYSTVTELTLFDLLINQTWHKDDSGAIAGQRITLYDGTVILPMEPVSVSVVANDSLVNVGIRRVKCLVMLVRNYRYE